MPEPSTIAARPRKSGKPLADQRIAAGRSVDRMPAPRPCRAKVQRKPTPTGRRRCPAKDHLCAASRPALTVVRSNGRGRGTELQHLAYDLSLLWIDMTVSVHDAETVQAFEKRCRIHRLPPLASIDSEIARLRPNGLCFDFDYPTKQSLSTLRETKTKHRSVPILMLTVQHSEPLAVWAFRSRVWDYMVKPLSRAEIERCLGSFAQMLSYRETAPRRAAMPASAIPEENRASAAASQQPLALAHALEYVERNYRGKVWSAKAASLCNLTTFQFSRIFRETYGLTFQDYLIRFRIREAGRLLKNPNAQVSEVALLVGFNDPSYFTKVFRRYTGVSPSRYAELADAPLDPERLLELLNGH